MSTIHKDETSYGHSEQYLSLTRLVRDDVTINGENFCSVAVFVFEAVNYKSR